MLTIKRALVITTFTLSSLGGILASVSGTCDAGGWAGNCTVSNSGTQVDVGGSTTLPGTSDPAPDSPDDRRAPPPGPQPGPSPTPTPECLLGRCQNLYEVATLPDVTIEDLASFRPARPSFAGEPAGFGVVGMPMNAIVAASEQRIAGTLFDYAVVVRFVPAAYVFEFGDGTTLRTSTGGASWLRLGQAQFTPTSTSHVYRERGTYAVRVTVQYSAAVDFGSGAWRPVPGYVSASADPSSVQVVAVRTALVDRTCGEDPTGPGC